MVGVGLEETPERVRGLTIPLPYWRGSLGWGGVIKYCFVRLFGGNDAG